MNAEQVIAKATELIETGKKDFADKTNAEKYRWFDNEYYVLYDSAIALLLENGFAKNADKKIQVAYFDIIPEPEIFTKNKEQLDNLYSKDEGSRVNSAKHFSKLARDEGSVFRGMFFKYPKTFELLFPALEDENQKVVTDIITTLGCAYNRYFKDLRVERELFKFYNHKSKEVLISAIIWTSGINKDEKYDYIFPLLETKQTAKVIEALCEHFGPNNDETIKRKALPILIDCLERKLPQSTKYKVATKIAHILDEGNIELFKNKLNLNSNKELKEVFREVINLYCDKERIAYLTGKIF